MRIALARRFLRVVKASGPRTAFLVAGSHATAAMVAG